MLKAAPYRALALCSVLIVPTFLGSAQAHADPWTGEWEASSKGLNLSATVKHVTAKPGYLVIDLTAGDADCAGSVTLYGKPNGRTLIGESRDAKDPSAPACKVTLSLDRTGRLSVKEGENCSTFHGDACGFDGSMVRSK